MFEKFRNWWNSLDDVIKQGWEMLGILIVTILSGWFLMGWIISLLLSR